MAGKAKTTPAKKPTPKASPAPVAEEVVDEVKEAEVKDETILQEEKPVTEQTAPVVDPPVDEVKEVPKDEPIEPKEEPITKKARPTECGKCELAYGSPSCKSCVVEKRLKK